MKKLSLNTEMNTGFVEVPVDFIDAYMPQASAEALKVYLYLLRAAADPSVILSVTDMADLFDVTPKKVLQAMAYWEDEGLVRLDTEGDELSGITLLPLVNAHPAAAAAETAPALVQTPAFQLPPAAQQNPSAAPALHQDAPIDFSALENDSAFTDLANLLQYYTKKPVTAVQFEALGFCYLLFDRNYDITEYLIEYCVEEGHTSMHYLKSVAKGWKEEGLTTLDEIRTQCANRRKRVYTVRKAFGINNRSLVQEELDYIDRWAADFSLDLISYACQRTVSQTGNVSFRYADTILSAWKDAGVHSKDDVAVLDQRFSEQAKRPQTGTAPRPAQRSAANFKERDVNYNEIARKFYE